MARHDEVQEQNGKRKCAREFIKPGTSVFDLGANFGEMSVLFSGMGSNITDDSLEANAFVGNFSKLNRAISLRKQGQTYHVSSSVFAWMN